MRRFVFTLHIVILLFNNNTSAQQIAKLTVDEVKNNLAFPVCIDLDHLTNEAGSSLALYEIINGKNKAIPFQVEHNYHRFLWWMIQKNNPSQKGKKVFVLMKRKKYCSF